MESIIEALNGGNALSLWLGISAVIIAGASLMSLLSGRIRERRGKEPQPVGMGMGAIIITVVVGMTALCIAMLLLRQSGSASDVSRLIDMQGITLAITGAAIALISVLSTLQNYDREKKSKEIEAELRERVEKLDRDIRDQSEKLQGDIQREMAGQRRQIESSLGMVSSNVAELEARSDLQRTEYEKLRSDIRDNIRVLFDCNSEDDIHLRIRIAKYREILKSSPNSLNVGLALIDALSRRNPTDTDRIQSDENDEIIRIADSLMEHAPDLGPLEWINLEIKKANACYENGKACVIRGDNEAAKQYCTRAQDIFNTLLTSDQVPRELTGYLEGFMGLCYYWQYRASGNSDDRMLDESIVHYGRCISYHPTDGRILNSLAVSNHNKARKIKSKAAKIDALLGVRTDYEKAIKADPLRVQAWLNVASVAADVIHEIIGIDPRNERHSFPEAVGQDDVSLIRRLCAEGTDHLEKAMMINPGFVNLYYVHADLNICLALADRENGRFDERLNDAKRRLEYGLLLDRANKPLHMIIRLYNDCIDELKLSGDRKLDA